MLLSLFALALFISDPNENWSHESTRVGAELLHYLVPLIPVSAFIKISSQWFANKIKTIELSDKQATVIFEKGQKALSSLTHVYLSKSNSNGYRAITLSSRTDFQTIPAYYDVDANESLEKVIVAYAKQQKIPIKTAE